MKRFFIMCLLASPALVATGCPMYDDTGCESELDCGPGYDCHLPTGACVRETSHGVTRCLEPEDCDAGETCDRFGRCVAEGAGGDGGATSGNGGAAGDVGSSGNGGAADDAGSSGNGGATGDAGSSGNGGAAAGDGGVAGEISAGAGG